MSASAEVYVSVSSEKSSDEVLGIVDAYLDDVGFPTSDSNYQHSRVRSGDIWEARGYSVSWSVFEQEWADGLIKAIYDAQPEADAEVYVYNLEREADNSSRTSRVRKEEVGV